MFCTKCGQCLPDTARFCTRCGNAFATPPAPRPMYQRPVYQQPVYQQPVYQQPAYQQPVYQQPVYQQPVQQRPVYQQPVYQQPVYQQPVYQQPAQQPPVYQQPVQPVAAPVPAPVPNPIPEPIPEPAPAPIPEPIPEPAPAPIPEPIPEPVPVRQPVHQPVTPPAPQRKKSGGSGAVIAIVCVLVLAIVGVAIWGFADGWLPDLISSETTVQSGNKNNSNSGNNSNGSNNGSNNNGPATTPNRDNLQAFQCGSVTIYLENDYKESSKSSNAAVCDNFYVIVYVAAISSPEGVKTPDQMAQQYASELSGYFSSVQVLNANGVSYVRAQDRGADNAEFYSYYHDGKQFWEVRASVYGLDEYEAEAVTAITTCTINN